MARTRIWHGHVAAGRRDEHESFVEWLNSDEARQQYAKYLLTGYGLAQTDDALTVSLSAEEPPAIIRFLRNPRMWPEFWEYDSAGDSGETPTPESVRVSWEKA